MSCLLTRLCVAVVLITSNLQGNTDMMRGCKEAGIPAFGTLWDFVSGWFPSPNRDTEADSLMIVIESFTIFRFC